MKCQFQGIADCVDLIENVDDYEYIVRMRTDLIFLSEIEMKDLETDVVLNQDGFVAGRDRPNSDWFFIVPSKQNQFYYDMAKLKNTLLMVLGIPIKFYLMLDKNMELNIMSLMFGHQLQLVDL